MLAPFLEPVVYINEFDSNQITEDNISWLSSVGFRKYTELNNKYNKIYSKLINDGQISVAFNKLKELVKYANENYSSGCRTYTNELKGTKFLGAYFMLIVKPLIARIEVYDLYAVKRNNDFISLYAKYGNEPQDYYSFLSSCISELNENEAGTLYLKIIFSECLRRLNNQM